MHTQGLQQDMIMWGRRVVGMATLSINGETQRKTCRELKSNTLIQVSKHASKFLSNEILVYVTSVPLFKSCIFLFHIIKSVTEKWKNIFLTYIFFITNQTDLAFMQTRHPVGDSYVSKAMDSVFKMRLTIETTITTSMPFLLSTKRPLSNILQDIGSFS